LRVSCHVERKIPWLHLVARSRTARRFGNAYSSIP
jgi:hypothetical protein